MKPPTKGPAGILIWLAFFAGGLASMILAIHLLAPQVKPGGPSGTGTAPPRRIVSLAPSITEVLFAVGAADRVAGVTSHCDYPPEAARKPKIGGYNTPNVELVLAVEPDLVLVPKEGAILAAVERLRALGMRVEPISVATLDDLGPAIERIAELAGRPDEGRALATSVTARIAAVRQAVAGRPRVRALLAVDHEPTFVAGPGTFGDDLLRAAGAENVAAGARSAYPQLGMEAILAGAPEVIIDAAMAPSAAPERVAQARAYWDRFPDIPAVRAGRVISIDPNLVVRPGPRLVDGLERLAREIHPEALTR